MFAEISNHMKWEKETTAFENILFIPSFSPLVYILCLVVKKRTQLGAKIDIE